ncbi:MAG: zinc ABC transporter permease [Firmicutes bacterium HGW-Firmicutes-2]|nr:MAG: zinc ABC transporter permease [Firmicutes bacterium HGW-Firmicutes-2]
MNILELLANDYTLRVVALGSAMLGFVSGIVGSFAVLNKQGLLGDAISHASLPGIAIMFLLIQTKSTELFMLGALIAGLTATALINAIVKYSRIKVDSAMALVLSVFFGFGLVLLTYIQKIPNANQAGLEKFIFGQASTLLRRDIYLILIIGLILMSLTIVFWKEFKIVTFDADFADSIGISSKRISYILSSMIVLSIIIGLQSVGVILMSALLVAPGVAARQWTNKLSVMIVLAGTFGTVSGLVGTIISSSMQKMPTGPSIVLVISFIVFVSMILSPSRGILWRYVRQIKHQSDINEDQVLLNLYDLAMNHNNPHHSHNIAAIEPMNTQGGKKLKQLKYILGNLQAKALVKEEQLDGWSITEEGLNYIMKHPMRKEENDVTSN